MSREKKTLFWLAGLVVAAIVVNALATMLLPFVAAMAIAYFLDPVADRLEAAGTSRAWGTAVIVCAFFVVVAGALILLAPLLQAQVVSLAALVPGVIDAVRAFAQPYLEAIQADLPPEAVAQLKAAAGDYVGTVVKWITGLVAGIWRGGVALFNLISLVIVTPVVAFYLLRDWDLIVERCDSYLPRAAAPTIRKQMRAIDDTIAGFVRGQASVCLVLATWYGAALSVLGLESGLLVGIGAGAISFVPYVGATVGIVVGVGIALFQFSDPIMVGAVALVFVVGQTAESYLLTPRLVGDRVGLHPVWIIFALMAGGALMGFTGVLLAVPVAAIVGVLIRFGLEQYLQSPLYGSGKAAASKASRRKAPSKRKRSAEASSRKAKAGSGS